MKKFFFVAALVLLAVAIASPSASAQTMFHQTDMLLSAGLGIGGYGFYGTGLTPPIFVAFEMGVAPKISVGGMIAYAGSSEDFGYGKWSYSYIPIAVRGSYHFLEGQKNLDAYAGAGLGYTVVSSSVTWNDPNIPHYNYSASGSYMFVDLHVGGRYFFSPKFAGMAELGYSDFGFVRVGLTYKIQ
jgi:hypothetical protein